MVGMGVGKVGEKGMGVGSTGGVGGMATPPTTPPKESEPLPDVEKDNTNTPGESKKGEPLAIVEGMPATKPNTTKQSKVEKMEGLTVLPAVAVKRRSPPPSSSSPSHSSPQSSSPVASSPPTSKSPSTSSSTSTSGSGSDSSTTPTLEVPGARAVPIVPSITSMSMSRTVPRELSPRTQSPRTMSPRTMSPSVISPGVVSPSAMSRTSPGMSRTAPDMISRTPSLDTDEEKTPFSPTSRKAPEFRIGSLDMQMGLGLQQLASPPVSRDGSGASSPARRASPPTHDSPTHGPSDEDSPSHLHLSDLSLSDSPNSHNTTSNGGSEGRVDTSDSSYAAFVRQWCFAQSAPPTPGVITASASPSASPAPVPSPGPAFGGLGVHMNGSMSSGLGMNGVGMNGMNGGGMNVGPRRQAAWPAEHQVGLGSGMGLGGGYGFPGFGLAGQGRRGSAMTEGLVGGEHLSSALSSSGSGAPSLSADALEALDALDSWGAQRADTLDTNVWDHAGRGGEISA